MRNYLKGDRLVLTALEPSDLDFLYRWENDTSLWNYSETLVPVSRNLLESFIASEGGNISESRQARMMIRAIGEDIPVGMIDLYDIDFLHGRGAVGILIDDSMRKQNYGIESLSLLSRYAYSRLGLHQIYAYVPVGNIASERLFVKAGYSLSGVLKDWHKIDGKYRDLQVYQLIMG